MKKGSVFFSTAIVAIFLAAVAVLSAILPWLLNEVSTYFGLVRNHTTAFLVTYYCCVPAAVAAMLCLLALLRDIRNGQPFSERTGKLLGGISWCCAEVAVATLIGCFFYLPFVVVTACALFLFLIVRVIRMCFMAAKELKDENSLTI